MALFDRSRQRITEKLEEVFFTNVAEKRERLEAQLALVMSQFFKDMTMAIGKETTPAQLTDIGYEWAGIGETWRKRKGYKEKNQFYLGAPRKRGRGGSPHMRDELSGLNTNEVFGTPTVTIFAKGSVRFDEKANRFRFVRATPNRKDPSQIFDPNNKGRRGRFTNALGGLKAELVVDAFPNIFGTGVGKNLGRGIYAGFGPNTAFKLALGDYGTFNRPARPFLQGFISYYSQVKIKNLLEEFTR
jgi:hypothetical protein